MSALLPTTQRAFGLLCLLVLLVQGSLVRKAAQISQVTTYDMVVLNVRVTDANRRAVADVSRERFQVVEDGVLQNIVFFSADQIPVDYGLVIDNSGSLRSQIEKVIVAGMKIVNSNTLEDEAFLVRFISSDKIEVVQEPTADKKLLLSGLQSLYIEAGQTAVIDAVYLAADKLAKKSAGGKIRRKALVLVTDGEDRNSYYNQEQLFSLLGTTDIQVYVVGFTGEVKEKERKKARELLNRLATDTGGRAFFPQTPADLVAISDEIINDIRTQYVIGYRASNSASNKDFHKVQVSIADDVNHEKRIAVTRVGYAPVEKQRN